MPSTRAKQQLLTPDAQPRDGGSLTLTQPGNLAQELGIPEPDLKDVGYGKVSSETACRAEPYKERERERKGEEEACCTNQLMCLRGHALSSSIQGAIASAEIMNPLGLGRLGRLQLVEQVRAWPLRWTGTAASCSDTPACDSKGAGFTTGVGIAGSGFVRVATLLCRWHVGHGRWQLRRL